MRYQEFAESSMCPECGGPSFSDLMLAEKQDACYHKVKSRYKVWPSAYASGALVQCRKKGAANWGNKSKNESMAEGAGNIGQQIKAAYQKIYDAGDDAVEFAYYDSPIFAQYWDEYEGDLDSIIAEVEPSELQVILDELTSAAEDQGVAEGSGDGYYYLQGGIERSKKFASEAEAMAHSKQFFQLARVSRVTLKYKEPGQPAVVVKEFTFNSPQPPKPPKSQMSWGDFYLQNKKQSVAEGSLNEFAPPGSGNGDDGFSEETLKRLAAQWYNGNEDPRVERTLMAAGWEIGQDEGYEDEPGVFVVQAGDVNGNSYLSWPAHELKQGVAEGNAIAEMKNLAGLK